MPKLICPDCGNEKLVVELRKKPCPKCGTKMIPADTKPKMPQVVLTHDEGAKISAAGDSTGSPQAPGGTKVKAPGGPKVKAPGGPKVKAPGGPKVKAPGGPKVKAPGDLDSQPAADATPEGKKE